jgi:hypothetical protein
MVLVCGCDAGGSIRPYRVPSFSGKLNSYCLPDDALNPRALGHGGTKGKVSVIVVPVPSAL